MQQQPTTTLFFGNLDTRVDRGMLYEIGVQAGPVVEVKIPADPTSGRTRGFGFVVRVVQTFFFQALHL